MKNLRPFSALVELLFPSLLTLSLMTVLLAVGACGGSDDGAEDPGVVDVAAEMDTGYDATEILGRLTDKEVYGDPEQIATLAADINTLKESRDFYTARRQAKELSVDFRNRPMQASMAAALMDQWKKKPPADITVADLEQAWAIRRIAKKTAEELAEEHALQLQDRRTRQSEVDAQRDAEEDRKEQVKVDTMGKWIERYHSATLDGRNALARVQAALGDPAKKNDLGPACRNLFQATQDIDGRIFRAPDAGIAQPLGTAWKNYRTASRSCMKGEMVYLTTHLAEGQAAIDQVNRILEGYGKSL